MPPNKDLFKARGGKKESAAVILALIDMLKGSVCRRKTVKMRPWVRDF